MAPTLSPAQPPAPANVLYSTPIIKRVLYNGTIGILPCPFPFAPEASKRDSGEKEPIKGALIMVAILILIGFVVAVAILYFRNKFPPPVAAVAGQQATQNAGDDDRSTSSARSTYYAPSPASYAEPSSPLHPNHHLRPLVTNLAVPANVHMPATQAGPGSRPAAAPPTALVPVFGDEDDLELFAIDSPSTLDGNDLADVYHQYVAREDDREQQNGAVVVRNLTHNL